MAWLLTYAPVRAALGLPTVLNVSLIRPEVPTPPPEPPKAQPKQIKVVKRAPEPVKPLPVLASQTSGPAPAAVYVPPPAEAPRAPPIDAAPPAPVVAAAPAPPKTVSGVEYLRPPQPQYPALARRRGEEGSVVLRVLVNTQGQPERVEVQKGSGSAALDDAARRAALQALFKPHFENGQAVTVWAIVPILFSLES